MKLKKLNARAIRGLRDLELPLEGKSLLIWGENGSGKSSIVDALEFLLTGEIRHLTGTQGISLEHHAHHQAFSRGDLQVDGTFDPGAITVSRTFAKLTPVPAALMPAWSTMSNGLCILRRNRLLEFIYADPADRFRTIGSMIGVESLDEIELAIMRVRDQLAGEVAAKQQEIDRIKATLGRIAELPPSEPREILDSINEDARKLGLVEISSLDGIAEAHQEWLRSARRADQTVVNSLNGVVAGCEAARIPPELEQQSIDLRSTYVRLASQRQSLARIAEVSLLREGRRLLELQTAETCPLCEQPIDPQATLARIVTRQETLQQLSGEFAAFRSDCRRTSDAYALASRRLAVLAAAVPHELSIDAKETAALQSIADEFRSFAELLERVASLEAQWDAMPPTGRFEELEGVLASIRRETAAALSTHAESDHDRAVLELITHGLELETGAKSYMEESAELGRVSELQERASYVYESFSNVKKAEIRRVYSSIEGEIRQFYDELHPGEPYANIELVLQEGRRASTHLRMSSFGGDPLDPRALSSEGHLDSLGLCIFLAFARHFLSASPLLVLDDLVMSVDASHRSRIAKLLIREFGDRQLVITTHDEIWFEEFVDHEEAYRVDGRFLNRRIQSWSFDDGARLENHCPRWEVIQRKLTDADKHGAANEGRQYAEWVLKQIVLRVRARVEIRRRHVFADLFEPARARLIDLLPAFAADIGSLFDELTAAGLPANFLSHENDLAPGVSIAEVGRFCDAVHALHEWFKCPSCGQLVSYVREVSELRCVNQHCLEQRIWRTR